ncbi:MAG: 16S rRNA (cytosine(1402)-N(4))-methyltransferase RsmH [bacterium]|nr:16S rRNA (cytosine(1402)-N(4))-methyltransferase RsmH [bacterium]
MSPHHEPVLCQQVVELLRPAAPGLLVDGTVGLGGHAVALLEAEPGFQLLALDRDPSALTFAAKRLERFSDRTRFAQHTLSELPDLLSDSSDFARPVAILADLGVSSLQLDTPERGFSFHTDGPLDMRMGTTGRTAAELVNTVSEEELMQILWEFGEERHSRKVARAICQQRAQVPFETTGQLSRLVRNIIHSRKTERIHPATRTFQALRIAVNDELGQLRSFLEPSISILPPRGRLAIISFHSLEDRIVKHTLRRMEGSCTCPPGLPICACGAQTRVKVLTRKPIRPSEEEVAENPRARSARLRAVERLDEEL